jgi:AcrR family transcriptional regulator
MCPTPSIRKPGRPVDPALAERRKSEILTVAASAFAAHGFAATDVQDIASRLGISKGTIYRYFPSKEGLFLAAVEWGLQELTAAIDAVLALSEADPVDVMRRAIRAYLHFFARRPEMAELFIQERAAFPHHHRPLYFAMGGPDGPSPEHRRFFEGLVSAGRVRPMPVGRFFNVIGDLLYGTILTNLLTGRPADPDEQAADVLDVVFHGVLTEAERRPGGMA